MMKTENFETMFRWDGRITCLHSELFLKGSHGLGDPLIIFHQDTWHTFLNKNKKDECLKIGLKLFKDDAKYKKYSQEFRKYIKQLKITKFDESNKKEITKSIKLLGKLWKYYGLTEFYFTDSAHQELAKTNDKILAKNLKDFGKLKIEGRTALNRLVFEDGVIPTMLKKVSKNFLTNEDDAFYLYSDEIIGLFDGLKINQQTINKRKKCYAIVKVEDKIIRCTHAKAQRLAKELTITSSIIATIKGITANKGIIKGKVTIAPMLTNIQKVQEIIKKMSQGDVLVAQSTTPELMVLVKKACAIVTDQGGMLSHAAIISREFNIPCIVGTGNATKLLKDGDIVEVDADAGVVKKLN